VSRTLVASVGRLGGVNHPGDVQNVQELLNQVPVGAGGPPVPLDPDMKCGPKTIEAIQKFQLFHFGWNGTDGRVDPDGQTLRKLNQFENGAFRRPLPVTMFTTMRCPHNGSVKATPTFGPVFTGTPLLKPTDKYVVTGCGALTPCVTVRWMTAAPVLDHSSVGQCLNAAGVAQGQVVFLN
jgi:Putative peptidoglycan binding domain